MRNRAVPIKCVSCYELRREEYNTTGGILVFYNCPRYFPYACALSGLIHPGKGILEAINECPERFGEHCALCAKTDLISYGQGLVYVCRDHDRAWGQWLNEHPEKRAYIAPEGRGRIKNWIEVWREFVEDFRRQRDETRKD